MPQAGAKLQELLNTKLDTLAAEYAERVAENVKNIESPRSVARR